jgi:Putative Ig domain
MSSIPNWVTPPGTLGTIPEGVFYYTPLVANASDTVYYQVIAGSLPPGIQIDETGVLSGNPQALSTVSGVPLSVTKDTTSQFAVRAYTETVIGGKSVIAGLADRTFTLTIAGVGVVTWETPAGSIGTYFDGVQITGLALAYTDSNNNATNIVTIIAGALPPGLTISTTGVISGYIIPTSDVTVPSTDYSFTLRVSNGTSSDVRTFSLLVYARVAMTADNTFITADNTFITADASPVQAPIITTPIGSIGSTRSDNFYAFQFTGIDFANQAFQFIAITDLPPGLTLDPNTGWLYGYIPYGGVLSADYSFELIAREVANPLIYSDPYAFSLTITGPVNSDIVWLTPADPIELAKVPSSLGEIDNGATSTFYVRAVNVSGIPLQYRLLSGSDSRLPQGLQLLPSGNIAGRVSFDTFVLDGTYYDGVYVAPTTFDVNLNTVHQPTTFDMVATFTVNAFSINGLVNVTKTFSITVVRRYTEPFDNLYIQAMPPQNDRDLLNNLLQNPSIFPPGLIYRNDDPNFGVATRVIYDHAYGLAPAILDEYVASLNLNHYWKNLILGNIKTAQAVDPGTGEVIYEVVYSEIIDNLVNNEGVSVGKEVVLAFPIDRNTPQELDAVWPNSLENMRDQVIDVVGQISNVLPTWMLSRQPNGQVLGFTPAWVIAYTNPGQSGQIAYNIQSQFGDQLNLIDFEVDRYELDNLLTRNWDRAGQHWTPQPPTLTTFDYGSANFNVDPWINNFVEYYNISRISGNGSQVTVTWYPNQPIPPFTIGQVVNISGIIPDEYNGNVTVTGCTSSGFTFDSAISGEVSGSGIVSTMPATVNWVNNDLEIVAWTNDYNGKPTTFDMDSLLFTAPVDMYSNTTEYDKYLMFPRRNILG